jgi:hypothetical protein
MAKFIIGVIVGIFLGSATSAYAAGAARSGTLSAWTITKHGEGVRSGTNSTGSCDRNSESHPWRANLSR